MELGLFMMPLHQPARDYAQVLEEDRQMIVLADRLGFAEAWCGEHYSATAEPVASPLMLFAACLPEAPSIRFGTAVFNLPQMHPALVASTAAQFDQMSGGRLIMGIGPGGLVSDFELLGITDPEARKSMMMESIDTIQALWSGGPPYEIPGTHWPVRLADNVIPEIGVGFMPKPMQQPHPPVCLSIVSPRSSSAKLAAHRGWGPISASFIQQRYLKSHWEAYAEGRAEAGIAADPGAWRVARSVLVCDSAQQTADLIDDPDGGLAFYFKYFSISYKRRGIFALLSPDPEQPEENFSVHDVARSMVIHGTPDQVLDQLIALREELGPFGTLLTVGHEWDDAPAWQRSMTLLAEEVAPRLRRHEAAGAKTRETA